MKCEDCRYYNYDEGGCEYPDMPPCDEGDALHALQEDLRKIEHEMQRIGREIRSEGEAMRRELEERIKLNLTGQEAITHYNAYMRRAGYAHLCVDQ